MLGLDFGLGVARGGGTVDGADPGGPVTGGGPGVANGRLCKLDNGVPRGVA